MNAKQSGQQIAKDNLLKFQSWIAGVDESGQSGLFSQIGCNPKDIGQILDEYEASHGLTLSDEQRLAVGKRPGGSQCRDKASGVGGGISPCHTASAGFGAEPQGFRR